MEDFLSSSGASSSNSAATAALGGPSSSISATNSPPTSTPRKRAGSDLGPSRKIFKFSEDGRIYRVRDNAYVSDIGASFREGTNEQPP